MSLSNRHKKTPVTFWVLTQASNPADPFGGGDTWARNETLCEFENGGGTQKDDSGAEFQPQTSIWPVALIPRGAKVKIGSHGDAVPPADSETVRKIGGGSGLSFQALEFEAYTG